VRLRYTGKVSGHSRLFTALVVALLPSACVCNASECGSTESATVRLMQSASELQGARAVACRNDVCQTVSLQPLADGLAQGSEVSLDVTEPDPDEGISLDTFAQPTSEGFVLTFLWSFFATSDLHVGDRLSVRISNPDDAELFAGAGKVAALNRDASDGCGPGCINVEVSLQ
jgi:hypothetical protein